MATSIGGLVVRRPDHLDEPVLALLRGLNACVVCTQGREGVIHSRAVWVDTDGTHVVLNSVEDRVWMRDIERDPQVTCTVVNQANLYEFASIEGRVVARTNEGADANIDAIAKKYLGVDVYPFHSPDDPRVMLLVEPVRILHMAPEAAELA